MPTPFPFEVFYVFGCKKCGGSYASIFMRGRQGYWNVSKTAITPVSCPKPCCPDCNIESEQETLVDITCKIIEFEKKIKEEKHANP